LSPMISATQADAIMTTVIARWRPNFSAASLPRMLAGIEITAKQKLSTTGLSHDGVPAYYFGKVIGTSVLAPKK